MHPQVFLVAQKIEHGVRDRADAHLHRRPIGDQFGDVLADLDVGVRKPTLRHRQFQQGIVHRHDVVQAADVDEGITQAAGHVLVDLGDDDF